MRLRNALLVGGLVTLLILTLNPAQAQDLSSYRLPNSLTSDP